MITDILDVLNWRHDLLAGRSITVSLADHEQIKPARRGLRARDGGTPPALSYLYFLVNGILAAALAGIPLISHLELPVILYSRSLCDFILLGFSVLVFSLTLLGFLWSYANDLPCDFTPCYFSFLRSSNLNLFYQNFISYRFPFTGFGHSRGAL